MHNSRDHQKTKINSISLIIMDLMTVLIVSCNLWKSFKDNSASSLVYVVISFIVMCFYVFKFLYIVQCWDEKKRMEYKWNRRMEIMPVFFFLC
mgnify:CR=1 FL=1